MFEVGNRYQNNLGEYMVLAIRGDVMDVQYLDGRQQALTIELQARIQQNRTLAQSVSQRVSPRSGRRVNYGSADYFTLGFLSVRLSHLGLNVVVEKEDVARRDYFDATGEELDSAQTGVSFLREGANQWGNQGVITFHASSSELSFLRFKGEPYDVPPALDAYEVKDIGYVRFMWLHGFRLGSGRSQNQEAIVALIPDSSRGTFEQGVKYGLRA